MAWLSGWDKRIELAIGDYAGDIGAEVTWFPVTVFLTNSQGEEVFVELTTDAEYLKVAFTKADGTTELYAEKELFDVSEELGIYHVSRDGWVINANTSIYMYYDADHADNTDYIGAINTVAGGNVWDGNFKAVYHMKDGADTSHIYDATSNNNDGTKKDVAEPAEATGKIGQGQEFDGSNDYIDCGNIPITTAITLEAWIEPDTFADYEAILANFVWAAVDEGYSFRVLSGGELSWRAVLSGSDTYSITSVATMNVDTWYYVVLTHDVSYTRLYIDNSLDKEDDSPQGAIVDEGKVVKIGWDDYAVGRNLDGIIDEVRISNTARTTAWIKGTYNSGMDTLLTYGNEELGVTQQAMAGTLTFAGTNIKKTTSSFVGAVSFVGSIVSALTNSIFLSGILTLTGTVSNLPKKALKGTLTLAGTLTRGIAISIEGALTFIGAIICGLSETLAGTISFIGENINKIKKFVGDKTRVRQ